MEKEEVKEVVENTIKEFFKKNGNGNGNSKSAFDKLLKVVNILALFFSGIALFTFKGMKDDIKVNCDEIKNIKEQRNEDIQRVSKVEVTTARNQQDINTYNMAFSAVIRDATRAVRRIQ